jgi:hypothetical protein
MVKSDTSIGTPLMTLTIQATSFIPLPNSLLPPRCKPPKSHTITRAQNNSPHATHARKAATSTLMQILQSIECLTIATTHFNSAIIMRTPGISVTPSSTCKIATAQNAHARPRRPSVCNDRSSNAKAKPKQRQGCYHKNANTNPLLTPPSSTLHSPSLCVVIHFRCIRDVSNQVFKGDIPAPFNLLTSL